MVLWRMLGRRTERVQEERYPVRIRACGEDGAWLRDVVLLVYPAGGGGALARADLRELGDTPELELELPVGEYAAEGEPLESVAHFYAAGRAEFAVPAEETVRVILPLKVRGNGSGAGGHADELDLEPRRHE